MNKRERRRHPATVQTPGVSVPDVDPDALMEPLIRDMEAISMSPNVEEDDKMEAEPSEEPTKRRRTTSASEAAVLNTISKSLVKPNTKKTNPEDSVWSHVKSVWNTIFS